MTLHDCFLEIAFEAELNTKEDPECLALAPQLCNEDPLTRDAAIDELREMIYERGECNPYRTDDAFLLKFLRARKFIIRRAHRLLVNYCKFKSTYPHLYDGVDLFGLSKVKGAYEGSMLDHPDIGRFSIFRFGVWDPNEFGVEDLVKAGLAMVEIGLRQPKLQILGGTALVDFEGITIRHVSHVTPSIAYQIVNLMGLSTPARPRSCHIVNYSWVWNTLFYATRKFIPESQWDTIHFHKDLKSLHRHIKPEYLPARYGGTCRNHVAIGTWFEKLKKYRNNEFDEDMKALGYVLKE